MQALIRNQSLFINLEVCPLEKQFALYLKVHDPYVFWFFVLGILLYQTDTFYPSRSSSLLMLKEHSWLYG